MLIQVTLNLLNKDFQGVKIVARGVVMEIEVMVLNLVIQG